MDHQFEVIEFEAYDGMRLNLLHLINSRHNKCPVLLVHGAGVRANIFNPPAENNIISMLARAGYDVWLENWRASIDLDLNPWDLDQAAYHDHPAAVKKIIELTGAHEIKAIIHCQGSTSFMISAVMGLVPEVTTILSNAVSLHPVVPSFSEFKINYMLPVVKTAYKYLNPAWGLKAPDIKAKLLKWVVSATHWEKDTTVGKFVSFTYGSGFPALWLLDNLDEKTMDWIQYEFAEVPLTFFSHIRKCIRKGELVPNYPEQANETSYLERKPNTEARFVLFGGEKNLCFLPDSQMRTHEYLTRHNSKKSKLYILQDYSHLDVFFGKNAHKDVFPIMIDELNQN